MELVLQREVLTDQSTIGKLTVDGKQVCFALEDTVRGHGQKVYGRTAIPAGKYKVAITMSKRFGRRLPEIQDVPGFTGIRIHPGNGAADTEGCLLVGLTHGDNYIGKSQMAMSLLQPLIQAALDRGEECWIEIRNPSDAALPIPQSKEE